MRPQGIIEGSGEHLPLRPGATFAMGHDGLSVSGTSGKSKSSKRKGASWKRFRQAPKDNGGVLRTEHNTPVQDEGDSNVKRKADDGGEVSAKISKQAEGLMVHQKPSESQ